MVGVGLLDGVGRVESVVEVGTFRGLTVGVTVGCSCEDATVCVAGHVNLLEVFARCLSWPWWLALNTSLYCLIALRFDDVSSRNSAFQDYVMEVGSLKRSASEAVGVLGCHELPSLKLVGAVGAVGCPELPSLKFVGAGGAVGVCDLQSVEIAGAVGCLCMFVLLLRFVRRLVVVRWFRRKRYVRRWRAVSVRLEAMMRPVSRDRTQVLVTNQKRQTQICYTLSHVVACLSWLRCVVATRAYFVVQLIWIFQMWTQQFCRAVHGKSCKLNHVGHEGEKRTPVPSVELLGALRGFPVRVLQFTRFPRSLVGGRARSSF